MRSAGSSAAMARSVVGLLEGQDAGERDVEAERDRAPRQLAAAGEAMQHGREGALPRFLLQDARHVVVGLARMDDQRQSGLARRRDVVAEALLLRVARAVVVVIVEPGLADRHDLGMAACARSGRRP